MTVRRIDLSQVHVDPVDLIGLSRLSDLPDASLTLSGTWQTSEPSRTPFTVRWNAKPPYTQEDADASEAQIIAAIGQLVLVLAKLLPEEA